MIQYYNLLSRVLISQNKLTNTIFNNSALMNLIPNFQIRPPIIQVFMLKLFNQNKYYRSNQSYSNAPYDYSKILLWALRIPYSNIAYSQLHIHAFSHRDIFHHLQTHIDMIEMIRKRQLLKWFYNGFACINREIDSLYIG